MTPLIKIAMRILDGPGADLTELGWFDITNGIKSYPEEIGRQCLKSPSPFEKYALCTNLGRASIVMMVIDKDDLVLIKSWGVAHERYSPLGTVAFQREEKGIRYITSKESGFIDPEEAPDDIRDRLVAILGMFFCALLENEITAYQPVVKNTFTNRRLKQKGKPLHYEWRTVVIKPKQPTKAHHGGTHASPRLHDRRGHWRTMKKSGKRVWVKQCKVGDPAKGAVFHDYKFKEIK